MSCYTAQILGKLLRITVKCRIYNKFTVSAVNAAKSAEVRTLQREALLPASAQWHAKPILALTLLSHTALFQAKAWCRHTVTLGEWLNFKHYWAIFTAV